MPRTSTTTLDRDEIRRQIRDSGLRVTMARVAVLEKLNAARSPLSHAELADVLVPEGLDRATVYRNLIDLTEANLVSRSELGDHVWRFESRRAGHGHDCEPHPHFVCITCGEVSCLANVKFELSPAPASGKSVIHELSEVLLKGQCVKCAS
ncbi:MAG: transcriptional repressor [Planctomycetaceae bacterium]|nr:transcriptional repressor [Planctomycetaceae bacterium]